MHKDHSKVVVQGSTLVLGLDNKLVPVLHNKVVAWVQGSKVRASVPDNKVRASAPDNKLEQVQGSTKELEHSSSFFGRA